ncbi:MAG: presenilin family intramembrane aspartyl protease [Candidatus ainarchaeum sp.]|nr:presenilin family intramembrane aspartyl protease [Candidatus ainarchaeum sp.]
MVKKVLKKIIKKKHNDSKKEKVIEDKTIFKNKEQNIEEKSWLDKNVFLKLGIVFLITQFLGIYVSLVLYSLGLNQGAFFEDINDINNSILLIIQILVFSGILLVILKFSKGRKVLWIIEFMAITMSAMIFFTAFFPTNDYIVLALIIILLVLRYTHRENVLIKNVTSIIAIVGAGGLIGITMGILPVLTFIILLSIYDYIAVFKTKHMLTLASAIVKNNFAFTVSFPNEKHKFELGNGDLVIPLIVVSSIISNGLFNNNVLVATLCSIGALAGLFFSIYIVSTKKIPLPALPPQTAIMVLIIIISWILKL